MAKALRMIYEAKNAKVYFVHPFFRLIVRFTLINMHNNSVYS